jgi:hypothetical protein
VGWLEWRWAVVLALVLGTFGVTTWSARPRWLATPGAFAREAALVLGLYAVWQYAGSLSVARIDEGFANGRAVWNIERALHLPSEVSLQRALIDIGPVMEFLHAFYTIVHVPALIACLVWLFTFHRDRYPSLRTTLAITTGACLLIQLAPTAPPRMYPHLGFVDSAQEYGQSVYGKIGTGIADQLSAMPSVHVAWAAFVALAVILASSSRWRWWILAHPALTIVAVTVSANHWWLDGVVAVVLLFLALGIDAVARVGLAQVRSSSRRAVPPRNNAIASSSSGSAFASASERRMGNQGSSLPQIMRPR